MCGVMSFVLSWSAHQLHEDAVPGGGAGTWVVHPILSLDHVIDIKLMIIDEIKDPCDNKHANPCKSSSCHFINFVKIHANQAPVTSFVYVFLVVNVVNVL